VNPPKPESTLGDLLLELEAEWRALGAPVDELVYPGLEREQVSGQLQDAFGKAPVELVEWFSWHNGGPINRRTAAQQLAAPMGRTLSPLEDCLSDRQSYLALPTETADGAVLPAWDPRWLSLTHYIGGGVLAFHVDHLTLIDVYWWDAEFTHSAADSMEEAVRTWVETLRAGYYAWEGGDWVYDVNRLPADLLERSIIG